MEFPLVYVGTSPLATAAMLGGDAQLLIDGGVGLVRTAVSGNSELAYIAGIKNYLTQSILAKPEIKRLEDLRGKKVGVTRVGATTPYFAMQAFKRRNMEAGRDYMMIQTGGAPEMFAALLSGAIDAGTMSSPWDTRAISQGYSYVVYGPDLKIPHVIRRGNSRTPIFAATTITVAHNLFLQTASRKLAAAKGEELFPLFLQPHDGSLFITASSSASSQSSWTSSGRFSRPKKLIDSSFGLTGGGNYCYMRPNRLLRRAGFFV